MSVSAETEWLLQATGSRAREFYSRIGVPLPERGGDELSVRCFARPEAHSHDDRRPSCSVNVLTGLFCCQGCGAKGNAYQAAIVLGWSERDAIKLSQDHGLSQEVEREKAKMPGERQLRKWREQLQTSPKVLARLTDVKGWTIPGMVRCGLGWDGERVTFPVRNHKLKCVGVVRYLPGGRPKSLALPGSKRMLFPAPEVTNRKRPLFIVEGEPDAVAVWSCGHQAVAVPGTGSWRTDWVQRLVGRQVIVIADCDPQGRELAAKLVREIPRARRMELAPWRSDGYDIGDLVLEASRERAWREMHGLLARCAA